MRKTNFRKQFSKYELKYIVSEIVYRKFVDHPNYHWIVERSARAKASLVTLLPEVRGILSFL
jgi:hypothetical protein